MKWNGCRDAMVADLTTHRLTTDSILYTESDGRKVELSRRMAAVYGGPCKCVTDGASSSSSIHAFPDGQCYCCLSPYTSDRRWRKTSSGKWVCGACKGN